MAKGTHRRMIAARRVLYNTLASSDGCSYVEALLLTTATVKMTGLVSRF